MQTQKQEPIFVLISAITVTRLPRLHFIMDDVDTDPKTITINTKVFGAYSIVY
jgi:hypothetical protein